MKKKIHLLLINLAIGLGGTHFASAQGTAFTYQGKLTDDCCPATGLYDLVFELYGSSNTGVALATLPPMLAVPVTNGLFTTKLPFANTLFDGSSRWLQIDVRSNNPANPAASFTPLLPRTELTQTPYAIYASSAGSVAAGGITAAALAPSPSSGQVLSYNGSALSWTSLNAAGGLTLPYSGTAASSGSLFTLNNSGSGPVATFLGNVGIGTSSPNSKLHVVSGGADLPPRLQSSGASGFSAGWDFYQGAVGRGYVGVPDLGAVYAPGEMLLFGGAGTKATIWAGGDRAVTVEPNGNVGIPTTDPQAKLLVIGGTGDGVVGKASGQNRSGVYGEHSGDGGGLSGRAYGANGTGVYGQSMHPNGRAALFDGRVRVNGDVDVRASQAVGRFVSASASSGSVLELGNTTVGSSYLGAINFTDNTGSTAGQIAYATDFGFTFSILGRERVLIDAGGNVTVGSLTIRGGADVAEPFQMSEEKIPEGSVVVIDEANPGRLKQSAKAYDTHVAGIVSGANGINPGIALHQDGAIEGGQNVALTGRVYVKADASFEAITPGDLLTTSDTPGHAMKVTEPTKAQGAILGKAMSTLERGKGMVLVLVTLQ